MKLSRRILVHLLLLLICVGFIGPFLWMICTSLKTAKEASHVPLTLLPNGLYLHNYKRVLDNPSFQMMLYARNTLIISVLATLGTVLSSSLAAYSLAKLRWRGRTTIFVIMLLSMMIPFQVTMVPMYREFRAMGMIGTTLPLWLPAFFGAPFFIFLLRQFYLTIPSEMSEAARIDGCSDFGIWWRIILPLSRPALAVVALFSFMGSWNNFIGPLVYLTHEKTFTLALALQFFDSRAGGANYELLMAASTLVILPIVVLFFLTQKTFIQGIATTGLKG